jgi:hypothetical protein
MRRIKASLIIATTIIALLVVACLGMFYFIVIPAEQSGIALSSVTGDLATILIVIILAATAPAIIALYYFWKAIRSIKYKVHAAKARVASIVSFFTLGTGPAFLALDTWQNFLTSSQEQFKYFSFSHNFVELVPVVTFVIYLVCMIKLIKRLT